MNIFRKNKGSEYTMPRMLTPEQKAAVLAKLKAGKEKHAAARADAKAKGLPDPKPRKKRSKAAAPLATDPSAHAPHNDTVRGIDATLKTNAVAEKPVNLDIDTTKAIDVPFLPEPSKRKKIVKNAEAKPEVAHSASLTTEGVPKLIAAQRDIVNNSTGTDIIEAQFPGQLKSIKTRLRQNKEIRAGPTPMPAAGGTGKTVRDVVKHIPDVKTIEASGKPFSFSAMKKLLYQG